VVAGGRGGACPQESDRNYGWMSSHFSFIFERYWCCTNSCLWINWQMSCPLELQFIWMLCSSNCCVMDFLANEMPIIGRNKLAIFLRALL